jgi:clan AA aspartic protease (TIGR02281 family)
MLGEKGRSVSLLLSKSASRLASFLTAVLLLTYGLSCSAQVDNYSEGVAAFQLGHYVKACTIFENCMAKRPDNPDLYYYAAVTYEKLRDYKNALEKYNFVIRNFPKTQAANLSTVAIHRGSFQSILASRGLASNFRDPHLDTYPKETWVSFTRHNNSLLLDGAINDHPTKMIFDTGASSCVFSVDQLEQLGIEPPSGPPTAATSGIGSKGKLPVWSTRANLRLGKIERKDFPIIVSPNPLPYPLLGENFIHDLKYTIDNDAKAVMFKYDPNTSASTANARPASAMTVSTTGNYVYNVPFTIENRALIVVAKLDGRDVPMIFDTGADVCMFTNEELDKYGLKPQFMGRNFNVRGANGTAPAQLCVIQKAQLGPISGQMPCLVTDQAVVPKPLMGQSFFKDWQYTIDHTNKIIQFVRK